MLRSVQGSPNTYIALLLGMQSYLLLCLVLTHIYVLFSLLLGISHMKWSGHNYFLSWREPWHKFEDWDWFNGRNFCRDRCMDLISFDTPGEFKLFAAIMQKGKTRFNKFVTKL